MSEWKEYKLGDCATIVCGFAFKSANFTDVRGLDTLPVIKIRNVANGDVNLCNISYHKYLDSYQDFIVKKNDILIAMTGNHPDALQQIVGGVSIYKLPQIALLNQRIAKIIPNSEIIDRFFLYYLLSDAKFHNEIASKSSGSANQANISKSDIEDINILLPPLSEQKQIAGILSSLDDKIDLLNRENKTLETMAETLFRKWFVEEAKEDWEEKPLSDIANFLNGLACQNYAPKDNIHKLPVLKIKELSSGITDDSDWATTDISHDYIVENGDVIFAWSASLIVKIWNGERCILNQHLFKVTSDKYPKWFYYMWCKQHLQEFKIIAESHATTMGHIKRGDLGTAMVLVPTNEELDSMTAEIQPLLDKIIDNNKQIHTLNQFRDTLLPKLLNEEVGIKE
jgi:type I restriction enzyme S subunit